MEGGGHGGGMGSQEAGAGPHFLLQIFFSYFPPLKPRCFLWSGASYSPKNMVNVPQEKQQNHQWLLNGTITALPRSGKGIISYSALKQDLGWPSEGP